jgi:hypothetical protein
MTRNVPRTDVEQIEGNGRSYPYLYPIDDLVQGNFHRGFHVCIDQISFLRTFLTSNELRINWKLTMMQAMMSATMLVVSMTRDFS